MQLSKLEKNTSPKISKLVPFLITNYRITWIPIGSRRLDQYLYNQKYSIKQTSLERFSTRLWTKLGAQLKAGETCLIILILIILKLF